MSKETKVHVWYAILAVVALLVFQGFWGEAQHIKTIPYSEFEKYLKDGQISEVVVSQRLIR